MTKTYKTKAHLFAIYVKVKGELKEILFTKNYILEGVKGSTYTTDNKEIQSALEKHPYFGKSWEGTFWTDDVEPEEQKQEETVSETAPIKRGRKPKAE